MRPRQRFLAYATGQLVAVAVLAAVLADLLGHAPGELEAGIDPTTLPTWVAWLTVRLAPAAVVALYIALPVGIGWALVNGDGRSPRTVWPAVTAAILAGPALLVATGSIALVSGPTVPGATISTAVALVVVLAGAAVAALGHDPTPASVPAVLFGNVAVLVVFVGAFVLVPPAVGDSGLDALVGDDPGRDALVADDLGLDTPPRPLEAADDAIWERHDTLAVRTGPRTPLRKTAGPNRPKIHRHTVDSRS